MRRRIAFQRLGLALLAILSNLAISSTAQAGQVVSGSSNSAFGIKAGQSVTGDNNSAVDFSAGSRVSGSDNSAVGHDAGDFARLRLGVCRNECADANCKRLQRER
jgi:hypothetical protein